MVVGRTGCLDEDEGPRIPDWVEDDSWKGIRDTSSDDGESGVDPLSVKTTTSPGPRLSPCRKKDSTNSCPNYSNQKFFIRSFTY